jgi:hypothetical protein
MLKTKPLQEKKGEGIVVAVIVSIIASSALYVLIVKLFLVKVIGLSVGNDGGYNATFFEVLILNLIVQVIGYQFFLLFEWIFKIRSRVSRSILAAVCLPAVWIGLFYMGFGVDWASPTTYVYLALLVAAGIFIVNFPVQYARIFKARS